MITRFTRLLTTVCVTMLIQGVAAQTAQWIVRPEQTAIQRMDHEYFKARNGGKYGVFSSIGFQVVPFMADSITDFVDGYAFALRLDDKGRRRILSIISSEQTVRQVVDEVYLTDDFPFFSRELMPVQDKKGKYGYLNTQGSLSIKCQYDYAKPFTHEELAAVTTGKLKKGSVPEIASSIVTSPRRVAYVNLMGKELKLPGEMGELCFGSTFRDGEAMVITTTGDMCTINVQGERVRDCAPHDYLAFDRQGMVIFPGEEEDAMYQPLVWPADGPMPFLEEGVYGYKQGNVIVVPSQFKMATPFSAGYAIVEGENGKYGVLGLVSESVRCEKRPGTLTTTDVTKEAVDYMIYLPRELNEATIKLNCIYEEGPEDARKSYTNGLERSFEFIHPRGKRVVQIYTDDLLIAEAFYESKKVAPPKNTVPAKQHKQGKITRFKVNTDDVIRESDNKGNTSSTKTKTTKSTTKTTTATGTDPANISISIAGGTTALKADSNDAASFSIVITNNGSSPVTTPVYVSGKGISATPRSVTIPAKGVAMVVATFSSIKAKENRTYTVKTSYRSLTKSMALSPFFTEF